MAGGRAASAVLPRSTLGIHNWENGDGNLHCLWRRPVDRSRQLCSLAAARQSSQRPPRSSGPLLLAPVRFRCERTGTAGGPDQGLEPSE
jgi:hypothetical protein